jgi:hypothetical protein
MGGIEVIRWVLSLDSLFQKIPITTRLKIEPFSQEVYLKIPRLNLVLKLSDSIPGYQVSSLHFSVE